MNDRAKQLIEKFKAAGGAFVMRDQLPELRAAGITEEDLTAAGIVIGDPPADEELVLVCASAARYYMADNVFTVCDRCGAAIQHRPGVPARAIKLCLKCSARHADQEGKQAPKNSA